MSLHHSKEKRIERDPWDAEPDIEIKPYTIKLFMWNNCKVDKDGEYWNGGYSTEEAALAAARKAMTEPDNG